MRRKRSPGTPSGAGAISIEWVNGVVAALFTALSVPLVWGALQGPELGMDRVGAGTLASMTVAVYALNAIMLGALVNRWTIRFVLPVLLIVNAIATYFAWSFGVVVDTSMMRNALATDLLEAREYLVPGLWLAVAGLGALPAFVLLRLRLRLRPLREAVMVRLVWSLAFFCVLMLALLSSYDALASLMRGHKHVRYLIAPGNVLVSTARALGERADVHARERVPIAHHPVLAPHAAGSRPHVLVLVVGETVRAQNWGLNGYRRQTTPELARRGVVNFSDVTACGTSTEISLPCMFSMQGRHEYDADEIARSESLLHLLSRAGVEVLWRDNQTGCKGVCDGLPYESFRSARDPRYCTADGCRDDILLDGLADRVRAVRTDTVIVLHQLGNHGPAYFQRYPPELRQFRPDCRTRELSRCSVQEVTNSYDNAVLATDRLLARVIDLLSGTSQVDSALLYVSDHGESLGESGLYLHGIPYPIAPDVQLKVPMVMWFSPGMQASRGIDMRCVQRRAGKPAEHDNLFHTVMGLLDVRATPYQRSHDLVAECLSPAEAHAASGVPAAEKAW